MAYKLQVAAPQVDEGRRNVSAMTGDVDDRLESTHRPKPHTRTIHVLYRWTPACRSKGVEYAYSVS